MTLQGWPKPHAAAPAMTSLHGACRRSNLEDPYITLPEEEAGSDDEDDTLRDSDLLILAARNDDDVSHLEVWLLLFRTE